MLRSSFSACRLIISMVFSSIYTLVLTLTCSPPRLRCSVQPIAVAFRSTHCRCGSFTSMPRLAFACLIYALPLHCVTKPRLASATLCCSMLCLCNSFLRKTMPLRTFAILSYSAPSPIIAIPCHRNSTLFYADAIRFVALPLRLFCISVQLALCPATASLVVLLLRYAYASLNVTNPRHAYAFQRLTKP